VTSQAYAPLDITPVWARINEELIELVDLVPDDKMNWSPKPEQWNFRGTFLHILTGRYGLMAGLLQDGKPNPDLLREVQSKDGIKELFRASWGRMEPFLSDAGALAREYDVPMQLVGGSTVRLSGHWLAFGQVEHDIHHRGDIYHYLGMLGIEHGEPDSLEREFRRQEAAQVTRGSNG